MYPLVSYLRPVLAVQLALLLAACGATTHSTVDSTGIPEGEADKLLVVDCMLPGEIRRLGTGLTFMTPRQPSKTTAIDCEIRGGEYVAYDRANYATALRVWLPQAQAGDPTAQVYVGEIYEQGLGLEPDYELAAHWYGLAAEHGDSRAQINLGSLYERGLGVPQDRVAALNWYRRASGLSHDNLAFTSSLAALESERQELLVERTELQEEIAVRQREILRLRNELTSTRTQLDDRRQRMETMENELRNARLDLETQRSRPVESREPQVIQALEDRIRDQEIQLEHRRAEIEYLQHSASRQQALLTAELRVAESHGRELETALERRQHEIDSLHRQLQATRDQLAERHARLERLHGELEQTRHALSRQQNADATTADVAALHQQLAEQEALLEQQRAEADQLRREAAAQQTQLAEELERARATEELLRTELAASESEAQYLRRQLADTEERLSEGRTLVAYLRGEHDRTRQMLAQQRTDSGDEETIRSLEAVIAEQRAELDRQEQTMSELEQSAEQQQAQLQAQLDAARDKEAQLQVNLSLQEEQGRTLEEQVAYLGRQLVEYQDRLEARQRELEVQTQQLSESEQQLEVRMRQTPTAADEEIVSQLRRDVDERDAELVRTRAQVALLQSLVEQNLGELTQLRQVVSSAPEGSGDQAIVPAAQLPQIDFGRYHALIIGNNSYDHLPNLNSAKRDAEEVANVLRTQYGFETRVLIDADRYTILSALNEFRQRLTEHDNFLLYYAGHGELDRSNARGHWLPVDAEPTSTANWISNIQITDILNAMTVKHAMVIADSCYSGTLARSITTATEGGRSSEKQVEWLRLMAQTRSRTVLTSGGLAPVLDTGGGAHSVFAKVLLDVLGTNGDVLEGPVLFREVVSRVKAIAAELDVEQDPQYAPMKFAGDLGAPFLFVPQGTISQL
ncbi:MAG: caspase family protein [Ectothiorhodospiraceae bacterium]|nr:caspase family protein [Ectothiorhodospiraceae bacterium]